MNKFSILTKSVLLLIGISIVSCKKTTDIPNPTLIDIGKQSKFTTNTTDVETLLTNPTDAEDEFINRKQYEMAKAITVMAANKDFVQFAVQTAKTNEGIITYEVLFKAFPQYKPLFAQTAIANRYGLEGFKTKGKSLDYDFVHNKFAYDAVIFVPNSEVADANLAPIVSPALEMWDDIANDNPDIVFGWEILSNGQTAEINIGEKDILTHPTFVTSLHTIKELVDVPINAIRKLDTSTMAIPHKRLNTSRSRMTRAKINPHYDRSAHTEFWGAGCQYIDKGTNGIHERVSGLSGRPTGVGIDNNFFIKYVHKSETGWNKTDGIGPDFGLNTIFYDILARAIPAHLIYYNTFERDWYACKKALGTVKLPTGILLRFDGRRVYHEEWLTFNPGADCGEGRNGTLSHDRNLVFPANLMHSTSEFNEGFDEGKGDLLFQRL
jgi:hypothetical protein